MNSIAETSSAECHVHAPPAKSGAGEKRTRIVIAISATMMAAELLVGKLTNSLSLTADGWHMATHVGALSLTAVAYWFARTHSNKAHFAFGTGKIYALAGFTSSGFLVAAAISMTVAAFERLVTPEVVDFTDALPVAIIGLVVNFISAMILGSDAHAGHSHAGHSHEGHSHAGHDHAHPHDHSHHDAAGRAHNLRAAYLHVVADALTSVLAIVALLLGRQFGIFWADPVVALLGAALIFKWGTGLVIDSGKMLIDYGPDETVRNEVRGALEKTGVSTSVVDLHLWKASPDVLACVVTVAAEQPATLDDYKKAVLSAAPVSHLTVEIRPRLRA